MSGELRDKALEAAAAGIDRAPIERWLSDALDALERSPVVPDFLKDVSRPVLVRLREHTEALADYSRAEALAFLSRFALGEPLPPVDAMTFEERLAAMRGASAELHADTVRRRERRAALFGLLEQVGATAVRVVVPALAAAALEELRG